MRIKQSNTFESPQNFDAQVESGVAQPSTVADDDVIIEIIHLDQLDQREILELVADDYATP